MLEIGRPAPGRVSDAVQHGTVEVVSRSELAQCPEWASAFAVQRKDYRYFEIVEDTIKQGFDYRYFVIRDESGEVCAVQPFFLLEQDLLAGASRRIGALIALLRRLWPRLLQVRTLMVGCVAGEGHVDGDETAQQLAMQLLATAIVSHARALRAPLIVLKEFPARYRRPLECFQQNSFTRVPSLPMTRLEIDYRSFDDYMNTVLSSKTRKDLRKKFRAASRAPAIEMSVMVDVSPIIDEVYPIYLKVYERSRLRFERLTKEYFCRLGQSMPDKVRFFVWRQNGKVIAFSMCMVHDDSLYAEYVGLDYVVALDLHLYHYVFRDVVAWAIANGYKHFRSTGLNYDPKLHWRSLLDPIDLYVRHTSRFLNAVLRRALPWLEPTRYDKTLHKFPNYHELWDRS